MVHPDARSHAVRERLAGRLAKVSKEEPISLVLIDDDHLRCEGVQALIHRQRCFNVVAAVADINRALAKVRLLKPDVVLLDCGREGRSGLGLTATIGVEVPVTKVIVMGLLPVYENVGNYMHAGAVGFVMKDTSFEGLVTTIQTVAGGGKVLPRALTESLFRHVVRPSAREDRTNVLEAGRLTNRDRQVIDLLIEGLCNKEIAKRLGIAIHTVKGHVHNVLEKLALRSRLEVAALVHSLDRQQPL